jgi:hypothetical protein
MARDPVASTVMVCVLARGGVRLAAFGNPCKGCGLGLSNDTPSRLATSEGLFWPTGVSVWLLLSQQADCRLLCIQPQPPLVSLAALARAHTPTDP